MTPEYIEQRTGGYYVAGTRISLDSVVYSFQRGSSPETIQAEYPLLKLAQIYGAIAYYLDHQSTVDGYLEQKGREFDDRTSVPLHEANPQLWAKLEGVRQAHGKKT